jgi:hypothetical protein
MRRRLGFGDAVAIGALGMVSATYAVVGLSR